MHEDCEGKQSKVSKIEEAKNSCIVLKYRYKLQKRQMGDTKARVYASGHNPLEREMLMEGD